MNVRLKRAKELAGYAVQLTKEEGLPTMVRRGAGFVKRRCFGKRARYLPAKKVLEAQRAEMAGKTAADCGLPTISVLTPLYNTPEKYLREFLDSFVGQTAPNGQLCLADASDAAHGDYQPRGGDESVALTTGKNAVGRYERQLSLFELAVFRYPAFPDEGA